MSALVYVGRDRCAGHDDGVPCSRRPAYLVKVKGCRPCAARRLPRCTTHPVCPEHAADVRAGRMQSHVDGSTVTPEELRSAPARCPLSQLPVDDCPHCSSPRGVPWPARFAAPCAACPHPIDAGEPVRWDAVDSRVVHAHHRPAVGAP